MRSETDTIESSERRMKYLLLLLTLLSLQSQAAITAKSYLISDSEGHVLLERDPDQIRSIASITKLFTARGAEAYDLNEFIRILPEDLRPSSRSSPLRVGHEYTRRELLSLALISSDNIAASALGRANILPPQALPPSTTIVEASGLDPQNRSTARDLLQVVREVLGTEIARTSIQPSVTIGGRTRRSTNPLLTNPAWEFKFSKTGFINEAGGCLAVAFESSGRTLIAVILGSRDVPARWRDLQELRHQVESTYAPNLVTTARHRYNRTKHRS